MLLYDHAKRFILFQQIVSSVAFTLVVQYSFTPRVSLLKFECGTSCYFECVCFYTYEWMFNSFVVLYDTQHMAMCRSHPLWVENGEFRAPKATLFLRGCCICSFNKFNLFVSLFEHCCLFLIVFTGFVERLCWGILGGPYDKSSKVKTHICLFVYFFLSFVTFRHTPRNSDRFELALWSAQGFTHRTHVPWTPYPCPMGRRIFSWSYKLLVFDHVNKS